MFILYGCMVCYKRTGQGNNSSLGFLDPWNHSIDIQMKAVQAIIKSDACNTTTYLVCCLTFILMPFTPRYETCRQFAGKNWLPVMPKIASKLVVFGSKNFSMILFWVLLDTFVDFLHTFCYFELFLAITYVNAKRIRRILKDL